MRCGRGLIAEAEAVRTVNEPTPPAVHFVCFEADVGLRAENLAVFVFNVT